MLLSDWGTINPEKRKIGPGKLQVGGNISSEF